MATAAFLWQFWQNEKQRFYDFDNQQFHLQVFPLNGVKFHPARLYKNSVLALFAFAFVRLCWLLRMVAIFFSIQL